jgi:hypothetical protein
MPTKYDVSLTPENRQELERLIRSGESSARSQTRARILLLTNENQKKKKEVARRLTQRFEWHYTPEHGSWLNRAEIELSILSRQCTKRRIPTKSCLPQK